MPELTAAELAGLVGGELLGDGSLRLTGVAALDQAGPSDVSFLATGRYLEDFRASRAGAVLLKPAHAGEEPGPAVRIVVPDPQAAMLRALASLFPEPQRPRGVEPTAVVAAGARLGADCYVGHHAVVGRGASLGERTVVLAGSVIGEEAVVGRDVTIHPCVTLYPRTVVGDRVILHSGVRLGVDGFGYVPGKTGHGKIPHAGRVVVGDDVEIGANTTVDRGSVGDTTIGRGTKIDNLVQIGHNCRVGERCFLMGQVGLAGSTRLEDDVILAGQVGTAGHLTVGRGARVAGQTGVVSDVPAGETWGGYPGRPHNDWRRESVAIRHLSPLVRHLEELVARDREK